MLAVLALAVLAAADKIVQLLVSINYVHNNQFTGHRVPTVE